MSVFINIYGRTRKHQAHFTSIFAMRERNIGGDASVGYGRAVAWLVKLSAADGSFIWQNALGRIGD